VFALFYRRMAKGVAINSFLFGGNEKKYLNECIDTGWISGEGPFIEKFENGFAGYIGRKHGTAVCNGTAALDIAVRLMDIKEGDEVILPTFTIISPLLSVVRSGARPVLVDSDPDTWNMDASQVESKITSKTKAIIIVHLYGLPANVDEILTLARKYNLKVIEDAAQMHGQTYKGKACGSFGDVSIFSFYPNKHITTGEGGMILTNDPELDEKAKKLRNLSFEAGDRRFIHQELGWNYRMTNMQAALGLAQLEQIESLLEKKRLIGRYYTEHLSFLISHGFQLPLTSTDHSENLYWVYGLVAPSEEERDKVSALLAKSSIGFRPFFWPMHEQPVLMDKNLFNGDQYPVAEKLARRGFYIPSGLGLTSEDLETVVNVFKSAYDKT
jgi:perosamine synthetase